MMKVQELLKELKVNVNIEGQVEYPGDGTSEKAACNHATEISDDPTLCKCCCASHCAISLHVAYGVKLAKPADFDDPIVDVSFGTRELLWDYQVDDIEDYTDDEERTIMTCENRPIKDSFLGLITALNTDLSSL